MTEQLKPCPHCGNTATVELIPDCDTGYFVVGCNARKQGCGSMAGYQKTEVEAITLWNTRPADSVKADFTGNLIEHARRELPGLRPGADGMDKLMAEQVLELLAVFSAHGHSGFSAPFAIGMFKDLANFEPLGPLTGEDDEWADISGGETKLWQNIRCLHVFKGEDGRAYNIEGKVFRQPDGCCYTSRDSRVYVEFPYTPERKYVDVTEGGIEIEPKPAKEPTDD